MNLSFYIFFFFLSNIQFPKKPKEKKWFTTNKQFFFKNKEQKIWTLTTKAENPLVTKLSQ
jgi:hypothetical protein